ncbi:slbp-P1-related protein [Clonorchis sinensis]|uniref:Slbp-P1-related protein n=1 Tax=Clonorchis sinensis TaxID=79923 RepID=G7YPS1_CLOSI|nr:slbp-P1-related protein [Clonorchis sinensis]
MKNVHVSFGDPEKAFVAHGEDGPEDVAVQDTKKSLGVLLSSSLIPRFVTRNRSKVFRYSSDNSQYSPLRGSYGFTGVHYLSFNVLSVAAKDGSSGSSAVKQESKSNLGSSVHIGSKRRFHPDYDPFIEIRRAKERLERYRNKDDWSADMLLSDDADEDLHRYEEKLKRRLRPSSRTDRFARPTSHLAADCVRPSSVTSLNTSKSVFKSRKPVHLVTFNVRSLKQASQQVALARSGCAPTFTNNSTFMPHRPSRGAISRVALLAAYSRAGVRKTRTPRLAIEKLVDPEVKRNYQNHLFECLPDGETECPCRPRSLVDPKAKKWKMQRMLEMCAAVPFDSFDWSSKPLVSEIIRDQNGSLICSKAERLDRWAQYFEQQFSWPPATSNPESWPSTESDCTYVNEFTCTSSSEGDGAHTLLLSDLYAPPLSTDTFAYIDDVTVCGKIGAEHDRNLRHFLEVAKTQYFERHKKQLRHWRNCSSGYHSQSLIVSLRRGIREPVEKRSGTTCGSFEHSSHLPLVRLLGSTRLPGLHGHLVRPEANMVLVERWNDCVQLMQQSLCLAIVFKDEDNVICIFQVEKVLAPKSLNTGVLKTLQSIRKTTRGNHFRTLLFVRQLLDSSQGSKVCAYKQRMIFTKSSGIPCCSGVLKRNNRSAESNALLKSRNTKIMKRNTMDPQLRPRFFDADPNSADPAKRWNHWFRTFDTYLKTAESSEPDKLETLIHFLDPLVYDHIADYTD